jgi:hypothetical protein
MKLLIDGSSSFYSKSREFPSTHFSGQRNYSCPYSFTHLLAHSVDSLHVPSAEDGWVNNGQEANTILSSWSLQSSGKDKYSIRKS